jgi:hypothetical protein
MGYENVTPIAGTLYRNIGTTKNPEWERIGECELNISTEIPETEFSEALREHTERIA